MKYKVKTTANAETDILRSFEWGVHHWGVAMARRWATQIRKSFKERLSTSPLGYPLAPDQDIGTGEVRHLIVSRYRVLFEVGDKVVHVLHVRGPYVPPDLSDKGEDE